MEWHGGRWRCPQAWIQAGGMRSGRRQRAAGCACVGVVEGVWAVGSAAAVKVGEVFKGMVCVKWW